MYKINLTLSYLFCNLLRVCKVWNDIVRRIKQTRKSLNWTCESCTDEDAAEDLVDGIKTYMQVKMRLQISVV